jgi:hypothetical protein
MSALDSNPDLVGPVLEAGQEARAVVAAIRQLNSNVFVQDRGSYLRIGVPLRCVLRRATIEHALGRAFRFPGDLECLMLSFKGHFTMTEDEAVWSFQQRP